MNAAYGDPGPVKGNVEGTHIPAEEEEAWFKTDEVLMGCICFGSMSESWFHRVKLSKGELT